MKEEINSNLPAIDDLDLRKQNTERIIGSVEHIGSYFRQTLKWQQWSLIINAIWIMIIIIFFVFVYGYGIMKGGLDSMVDTRSMTRRFNCTSGDTSDVVRSYDDAESFLKIWGGSCTLYQVNENG